MTGMTEQIEKLVQPLLDDLNFELVDLEYKREPRGWLLRFYLDKPGGITLDDCADASREISSLLDVEDCLPHAYTLEVSSPGIERPLKKPADFERFAGSTAKIKTLDSIAPDGGKPRKPFVGQLDGFADGAIKLTLDNKAGTAITIPLEQVEKANLVFEF